MQRLRVLQAHGTFSKDQLNIFSAPRLDDPIVIDLVPLKRS